MENKDTVQHIEDLIGRLELLGRFPWTWMKQRYRVHIETEETGL